MSAECDYCGDHSLDCHCKGDISTKMVDAVIRIGRAQEYLKSIIENQIFNNLSKHDQKWKSEHEKESELLDDTRMSLSCLSDNLWYLNTILLGQ